MQKAVSFAEQINADPHDRFVAAQAVETLAEQIEAADEFDHTVKEDIHSDYGSE